MPIYPMPEQEAERSAQLHGIEILDSLPAQTYDRITRLAVNVLDVPMALVSLVDDERQWAKSQIGLCADQTPATLAFCARAICHRDVFVVEDTQTDSRFANQDRIAVPPHIRFCASVPLRFGNANPMGMLCVLDTKPRQISTLDKQLLFDLGQIVMEALKTRLLAHRAETAENRLIDAMESLPSGFVLYDKDDRLVLCNKRYKEMYSLSAQSIRPGAKFEEIIRNGLKNRQYPDAIGNEEAWLAQRMEAHLNPGDPIEQHLPDDQWIRVQERRTSEGGLVGFRVDITKLKRQERELARLAWTDSLTGAMNRHRFIELSDKQITHAKELDHSVSLLLVDVDYFKRINDCFGHAAGDAVLKSLIARFSKALRLNDFVGRIGGEEFCILLPESNEKQAMKTAERLRALVADMPFAFDGQLLTVTISIGIAALHQDDSLPDLMQRADKALYEAKNAGRDRIVLSAA